MFKTLTIFCIFSFLSLPLFSQELTPNEKLAGLSLGMRVSKYSTQVPEFIYFDTLRSPSYLRDEIYRNFDFSFQSARMVSKKWSLGVGITGYFSRTTRNQTYFDGEHYFYQERDASITPYCFVQYFRPINKRFLITGKFQTGFELEAYGRKSLSSNSNFIVPFSLETITANLRLSPSFVYLLHPRILIELDLGQINMYSNAKSKEYWFDFNVRPSWSNIRLWWRFDAKTPPQ